MKKRLLPLACFFVGFASFGFLSTPVMAVEHGDTLADALQELGAPTGKIKKGTVEVYFFDRGSIEVENGRILRTALLTADEAALKSQKKEINAQRREEQRQESLQKAEALKASVLANTEFSRQPLAYQLAFWKKFKARYPEMDIATILLPLESALEQQAKERALAEAEKAKISEQKIQTPIPPMCEWDYLQRTANQPRDRESVYYPLLTYGFRQSYHRTSPSYLEKPRPVVAPPSQIPPPHPLPGGYTPTITAPIVNLPSGPTR